jgi:signal peptidase I
LEIDLQLYTNDMWGRHHLVDYLPPIAASVVFIVVIMLFVAWPYRISQTSMQNTLQPEDFVLVDKITPKLFGFNRGDVVVFHLPDHMSNGHDDTALIKRVIGMPGETISIGPDGVRVNGLLLEERYLFEEDLGGSDGSQSWTVGDDELLVFGDHRTGSIDSRKYGPIPVSAVIGRAVVRLLPLDRIGAIASPSYQVAP